MRHPVGPALVALLLPAAAHAAWPEDVTLSGMTVHDGIRVVDTEQLSEDYAQLIRELGASIATATILPPGTLGASGFEVVAESNLAVTSTSDRLGPSPWSRAHVDEDPGAFFFAPGVTVRKGLPFSVELGMTGRWVGMSRQGVFGGFLRAALVEGWKPYPDVGVHLGYTGYVGNDELELGVFELGGSLGSQWAFGSTGGVRTTKIAPYLDITLLVISATPLLSDDDVIAIGAVTYGRRSHNPEALASQPAIATARFSGGLQLITGQFVLRVTGGYTLRAVGNVAVAVGFTY
ncbi:MAG: hypothetical protein H6733_02810 [Alphaproteobacteria bacterium]|nr:hypothetical protein [Alphaproteobacteria bacterium]